MTKKTTEKLKSFLFSTALDSCYAAVNTKNRKNLQTFSILGLIILFISILTFSISNSFLFSRELYILFAYFLIINCVVFFLENHIRSFTSAFYLFIIPVMLLSIVLGTFASPKQPSITIMLFICALPLFILDKPFKIILLIIGVSALYGICSFITKSNEIFLTDMIALFISTILSIGINCLTLKDKIDNITYARKLKSMSESDYLTRLYNRSAGEEMVSQLLNPDTNQMFILIDVDDLKLINNSYGYSIGDKALISISIAIRQSFRNDDVIMRFGGDEFAIFTPTLASKEDGISCIERMMENIHNISIYEIPNHYFTISAGGIYIPAKSSLTFNDLYQKSDCELYIAKLNGKNRYNLLG